MQSQSTLTNKNFRKDGNAIGLQKLVDSCNQANKKTIAGVWWGTSEFQI
jgi:hypothetical protein